MAFQWRFNGVNISDATNSSYTILNAQPPNVGSYSVQVVNGFGTTPSSLATLSFIVPTIACPGNLTTNTASGLCSQVVIGIGPAFGDNCPGTTLTYALSGATTGSGTGSASGKTFNKGVTTVRYTVSDASTNSATCSFTVTVNDHENPTIACPATLPPTPLRACALRWSLGLAQRSATTARAARWLMCSAARPPAAGRAQPAARPSTKV
jgi:hypothetical protein